MKENFGIFYLRFVARKVCILGMINVGDMKCKACQCDEIILYIFYGYVLWIYEWGGYIIWNGFRGV